MIAFKSVKTGGAPLEIVFSVANYLSKSRSPTAFHQQMNTGDIHDLIQLSLFPPKKYSNEPIKEAVAIKNLSVC